MHLRDLTIRVILAILAFSVAPLNEIYARGPAGRTTGSTSAAARAAIAARIAAQQALLRAGTTMPSTSVGSQVVASNAALAALTAQIAAQNPRLSQQQASLLAGEQLSAIVNQRASQLATEYPQLSAQQAALLASQEIPSIATQLQVSNTVRASLAAQIAAQNPQLSAQQVNLLASQEISGIATQQSNAASTALAAQISAQNPLLTTQQAYALATQQIATTGTPGVRASLAAQISAQNPQLTAQQAYELAGAELTASRLTGFFPPGTPGFPAVTPGVSPFFNNGTFQPAVPVEEGSSGGGGASETADGAALEGTAQVIRATGQFDQASAAGAVNMAQAESDEMRNQVQGIRTFYEMRAAGRVGRESEGRPVPTSEEFSRRARAGAPRGLEVSQMDPVTGDLHWPGPLQSAEYSSQRSAVNEYTVKWARYGGLDSTDQMRVRENILAMFEVLKSQMGELPPEEYLACRSFLQGLLYATTRSLI